MLSVTAAGLAASACGRPPARVDGAGPARSPALTSRSHDWPETVDVGCWNVEWLGDAERGPRDDARQVHNVATVLQGLDLDVMGLVEVVSEDAFASLIDALPGFHGVLVTDPIVEGGADAYGADEQKLALIVRDRFEVTRARVVLADQSWTFAGRPPLEVSLAFREGGRPRTLDVVVVHLKAMANADGYARRTRAAQALDAWLTAEHAWDWVAVIGDFNDDLDASTYQGRASPLAALTGDGARTFTTAALTAQAIATTVHFPNTIDHHLASRSLAARFVDGTAEVLRPDAWVDEFGDTTSDHYPVLTRYDLR
jgi:endonuclease/exonuclease/phosphatase family metal-dependent hydrolase